MADQPIARYINGEAIDRVRVAKPCPAAWSRMEGDDFVRHCSRCTRNVYNISELTRDEANALLQKHEGKMCVRMYLRSDGRVMTKDCGWFVKRVWKIRSLCVPIIAAFGFTMMPATVAGARAIDPEISIVREQEKLIHVNNLIRCEKNSKKKAELKDNRDYVWMRIVRSATSLAGVAPNTDVVSYPEG